jgi:hypothetical protein
MTKQEAIIKLGVEINFCHYLASTLPDEPAEDLRAMGENLKNIREFIKTIPDENREVS